jgi:hypothetical protein
MHEYILCMWHLRLDALSDDRHGRSSVDADHVTQQVHQSHRGEQAPESAGTCHRDTDQHVQSCHMGSNTGRAPALETEQEHTRTEFPQSPHNQFYKTHAVRKLKKQTHNGINPRQFLNIAVKNCTSDLSRPSSTPDTIHAAIHRPCRALVPENPRPAQPPIACGTV